MYIKVYGKKEILKEISKTIRKNINDEFVQIIHPHHSKKEEYKGYTDCFVVKINAKYLLEILKDVELFYKFLNLFYDTAAQKTATYVELQELKNEEYKLFKRKNQKKDEK